MANTLAEKVVAKALESDALAQKLSAKDLARLRALLLKPQLPSSEEVAALLAGSRK